MDLNYTVNKKPLLHNPLNQGTIVSNDYKNINEKLQIRVRYLEDFIANITDFENTLNILDLKGFLSKQNYRRFCMLLDEVFELKQKVEDEKFNSNTYIQELTQLKKKVPINPEVGELHKKLQQYEQTIQQQDEYIQSLQNQQQPAEFNSLNNVQLREQISNLEDTIKMLTIEIEDLSQKNIEYRKQIQKKDFFKDYDSMCKEVNGLRKQNQQLEEKIKVRDPTPTRVDKDKFSLFK